MAAVMQARLIRQQNAVGMGVLGVDPLVSAALPQLAPMFRLPLPSATRKAPVPPEAAVGQVPAVIAHLFHRILLHLPAADKQAAPGSTPPASAEEQAVKAQADTLCLLHTYLLVVLEADTLRIRQQHAAGLLVVPGMDQAVSVLLRAEVQPPTLHHQVIPPRVVDIPVVLIRVAAVHTPEEVLTREVLTRAVAVLTLLPHPAVIHLLPQAVTPPHPRVLTLLPHPAGHIVRHLQAVIPHPHREVILLLHQEAILLLLVVTLEAVLPLQHPQVEIQAVQHLLRLLVVIQVVPLPLPLPQVVIQVVQCPQLQLPQYRG